MDITKVWICIQFAILILLLYPKYIWRTNFVIYKGPKTKRTLYLKERDPHLHREFSDPVYQIKLNQTKGQTFNKLRKGDGNDVTPNPIKLYQLGKQIQDLSNNSSSAGYEINYMDQPTTTTTNNNNNETSEVKKEKNKIASRFVNCQTSFEYFSSLL